MYLKLIRELTEEQLKTLYNAYKGDRRINGEIHAGGLLILMEIFVNQATNENTRRKRAQVLARCYRFFAKRGDNPIKTLNWSHYVSDLDGAYRKRWSHWTHRTTLNSFLRFCGADFRLLPDEYVIKFNVTVKPLKFDL